MNRKIVTESEYRIIDSYSFYNEFEKSNIIYFIEKNNFLIPILKEAQEKIKEVFGETDVLLSILQDPEEDFEELFIIIKYSCEIKSAMSLLNKLFKEWFLNILPQTQGLLNITIEKKE